MANNTLFKYKYSRLKQIEVKTKLILNNGFFQIFSIFCTFIISTTSAAPTAPVWFGNNVQGIGVNSQNIANIFGNQQAVVANSENVQNVVQQGNNDASEIKFLSDINILNFFSRIAAM
ncbi:hypothetical protein CONCODRAFT_8346 [Conidiobolus coronatus NRRL 28638]|uniref:Uncharacterized protein n=1 Tax=Conidiobolus coronatus (strain ATCC 28846 / CBS 209.66 / NRRL 28638) TaxID=796925 RepID=A0A137P2H0_CONC2|nr:hypothetical protein CONCODRAFT_8346 [Conidiobolus coronatus NRRL 28638]|eukprot:KXN69236.1 hypothetical protein CONCODRAFT_8346 [Conidiobolus coronatus NRRL 28638]